MEANEEKVQCPLCDYKDSSDQVTKHINMGCASNQAKARQKQQWSFLTDKKPKPKPSSAANNIPIKDEPNQEESKPANTNASPPSKNSVAKEPPAKKPKIDNFAPLAEQMRPNLVEDYIGQSHLMGPQGILRQIIDHGDVKKLPSMILWGPSGVGKTTLARVIANKLNAKFIELSAPSASANDVKKLIADARKDWQLLQRRTILFLDEIHRFTRTQQDSLLAGVERGDIILIGATTENPSFKLTGALLSRTRVFVLQSLRREELETVVKRAGPDTRPEIIEMIVNAASATGDARQALNMLETARSLPPDADPSLLLKHQMVYDQRGEFHYDLISAFHKSIRGSNADAALYYLTRMLSGGEDPLYISRRMVRIASEDIGLADDSCLPFTVAVHTSVQQIGMPEADVMLAHAAVKLARAPKSVEVYKAYKSLFAEMQADPAVNGAKVPMHLRNAPTKLMDDLGYGENYKYNPDYKGEVRQTYLPKELQGRKWLGEFQPTKEDH